MPERRVLVVGTTPDYIAHICKNDPARALFLTSPELRHGSSEPEPDVSSEILCELGRTDAVLSALEDHLRKQRWELSGVVCYDCEWLGLAARIAGEYSLSFPSPESINLCRNKYRTKLRWMERGVLCPRTQLIRTLDQVLQFAADLNRPVVLKPLTGAGSELTFRCKGPDRISHAYALIKAGLAQRVRSPLFNDPAAIGAADPAESILAEEYIEGPEYSADFIIDSADITLIRVAKKLRAPELPFGTTRAYIVPAQLPGWLSHRDLRRQFKDAATVLGLDRAICMVDFIVDPDRVVFLELTPRIGGDCLPPLIQQCCGMDTIELAMDFAEGRRPVVPPRSEWRTMVGLRLFADRPGVLKNIDLRKTMADARVREVYLRRSPGDQIILPPEDYDSWITGHIIFEPETSADLTGQCKEIGATFGMEWETKYDRTFSELHPPGRGVAQPTDTSA